MIDPLGRQDAAGRVIPHDFVVMGIWLTTSSPCVTALRRSGHLLRTSTPRCGTGGHRFRRSSRASVANLRDALDSAQRSLSVCRRSWSRRWSLLQRAGATVSAAGRRLCARGSSPAGSPRQHLCMVLPVAVQWHRVLDRALSRSAVVTVGDAVTEHLGRTPTRSEMSAARRAAHRYATTGEAQEAILSAVVGGTARRVLILARPDVDLHDVSALRRSAAKPARILVKPQGQMTKDTARRAETLLTEVAKSARASRLLPVTQIEPAHARLLAEDLSEAIADLAALAADLTRRSRQGSPTERGLRQSEPS